MKTWDVLSDQALLEIANEMMDEVMQASTQKDYQRHIRYFSQRAQSAIDETQFQIMCGVYQQKMGYFSDRSFVALFRRPESVAVIWRQNYSKVAGDFVAEMVMVIEDNEYRVDHAFVF